MRTHLMCSSRKECWGQWNTGGTVLSSSLVITNKTKCDSWYLQALQQVCLYCVAIISDLDIE